MFQPHPNPQVAFCVFYTKELKEQLAKFVKNFWAK
jgi:hypothetical protein